LQQVKAHLAFFCFGSDFWRKNKNKERKKARVNIF